MQQKFAIENDNGTSLSSSMSINNSGTSNTGNGGLSGTNLNLNESVGKKRKIKPESKIKFRKNFNTLIEEEVLLKIILYSTLFF